MDSEDEKEPNLEFTTPAPNPDLARAARLAELRRARGDDGTMEEEPDSGVNDAVEIQNTTGGAAPPVVEEGNAVVGDDGMLLDGAEAVRVPLPPDPEPVRWSSVASQKLGEISEEIVGQMGEDEQFPPLKKYSEDEALDLNRLRLTNSPLDAQQLGLIKKEILEVIVAAAMILLSKEDFMETRQVPLTVKRGVAYILGRMFPRMTSEGPSTLDSLGNDGLDHLLYRLAFQDASMDLAVALHNALLARIMDRMGDMGRMSSSFAY